VGSPGHEHRENRVAGTAPVTWGGSSRAGSSPR
jgi:hypothetical protein